MRYSFESRCRAVAAMVAGLSPGVAAQAVGASRATGYRWWQRYVTAGWVGLPERASTPTHQPRRLSPAVEAEILAARQRSGARPVTLGALLRRPAATVGKVLRRLGHSRRPRAQPGELLHLDTKKLGRFWQVGKRIYRDGVQRSPRAGWQHVHVAVDDHSRLAYAEVRPSDRQGVALAFLERARAWFRAQGIAVQAVMTDNGPAYRAHAWRQHCAAHDLRHLRTRPYRPQTNGKAEAFIRTLLREWAYVRPYLSNAARLTALPPWLYAYNHSRPHSGLDGRTPAQRLSVNNLSGKNI